MLRTRRNLLPALLLLATVASACGPDRDRSTAGRDIDAGQDVDDAEASVPTAPVDGGHPSLPVDGGESEDETRRDGGASRDAGVSLGDLFDACTLDVGCRPGLSCAGDFPELTCLRNCDDGGCPAPNECLLLSSEETRCVLMGTGRQGDYCFDASDCDGGYGCFSNTCRKICGVGSGRGCDFGDICGGVRGWSLYGACADG